MESSRIFIRGLPPTITEAELRKHFSTKGQVSDTKCFPQRRIGYVGYKTPQEAAEAVKYFNRTFIRMSRINVELAKPIADPTLPKAKHHSDGPSAASSAGKAASHPPVAHEQPDANVKKRKREGLDESDPKLKEFLHVMQSKKISDEKILAPEDDVAVEPPTKKHARAGEDDDEYQSLPMQSTRQTSNPPSATAHPGREANAEPVHRSSAEPTKMVSHTPEDQPTPVVSAVPEVHSTADDDDWLRNRTNRLLDLEDGDDSIPVRAEPTPAASTVYAAPPAHSREEVMEDAPPIFEEKALQEAAPTGQSDDAALEAVRKTARIFCRNLPYTATAEELRTHFEQFGEVEEVHVPTDASNNNRGMGYVLFHDPEDAVRAFQSDRTTFQGRILHVLPSKPKLDQLDEFAIAKLPLKQQNLIKKRNKAAASTWTWNSLYLSQDAVNTTVAGRLGVSKSELLDPTNSDAAVKQALAEAETIQDTKSYFVANGVNLDSFKSKPRSDDTILVKNLEANTKAEQIRALFEEHGRVLRVLVPPTGVIAIVQFASSSDGKRAFAKLAYRRFGSSQLFLEKAPRDLFTSQPTEAASATAEPVKAVQKVSASDLLEEEKEAEAKSAAYATLFVKNLNFDTTTSQLAEAFQHLEGFKSAVVKTKKDMKHPGQTLSMGFGFVTFENSDLAAAASKVMDGHALMGHKLSVRASHRGLDAAEERKKKDEVANKATTTLVVKNLPFQASKREVKTLFSAYSQVKAVRMPKKFNHSGRGFAFVDFPSTKEAASALQALEGTHLLGRRLILQYAEADAVDAEEEIAKMQKKVGGQVNKVALQELTGQGRKKFTIGGGDGDEGD
ncbi:MRD1-like protein [Xylariaceae sp. FL0594]|nr:MRD1-like protein [Xylariaceae sp. FL0594]